MIKEKIERFITRIKRGEEGKYLFFGDGYHMCEISRGETTRECLEAYGEYLKEQLDILDEIL